MSTYSQMHVQIVFAVKYRQALIHSSWEERLYSYIAGTIKNMGHKPLLINGVEDHIHILMVYDRYIAFRRLLEKLKNQVHK